MPLRSFKHLSLILRYPHTSPKVLSVGWIWHWISKASMMACLENVLIFYKSFPYFWVFLGQHGLIRCHESLWFHWLLRNFLYRQNIQRIWIVSVKEPEMRIVPDNFISVIKIFSIVMRSILQHLLHSFIVFDLIYRLKLIVLY